MRKHLLRIALLFMLVSVACSFPVAPPNMPTPQAVSQLNPMLVTLDPNATATPTPFQPLGPTATHEPYTATPGAVPLPNDLDGEDINMPTPIRVGGTNPKGQLNLLVLGSDFRPASGFRTDVIMLVSINPQKGTVSVVSFPRDLYVTIPGWGENRINTAFPHGGFQMMQDTFEYNFGVRPTHYLMTNFQGFRGIIDDLGGINVQVGSYLSDSCDLPQASYGYCTVNPGTVWMDGGMALWYVRSRHTSNDFDRGRRQQEVLYALFSKLMSLDAVTRLPDMYNTYQNNVETNLSVGDLAPLLPVASQVLDDSSRIRRFAIGPAETSNYITSGGAMVLLPDYAAINAIINQAVYNP